MNAEQHIYEFDDVRIEASEFRVTKGGKTLNLEPKPFAVLLALVARAGSLVSKDELLDTVWSDSFVTPNVLTRAIAQIRRELEDGKKSTKYITTVPKHGYRFVGDLKQLPLGTPEHTLAVLPFTHLNPDANNSYLSVGLADSLITKLMNIRALALRPTSSVLRYADTDDIASVGKQLRVENVILGTIQEAEGTLRVSVQLIRVGDNKPLWGNSYTSKTGDLFEVQDEIAARIAESLELRLNGGEQLRIGRRPTVSPEANRLYMQGRYHLDPFSKEGQLKAIRLFKKAVELDSGFALAHSGLAGAYLFGSQFGDDEAAELAEASAVAAVETDPSLAEGHAVLAAVQFWKRFEDEKAEGSFVRALALDPNSSETNYFYAWFLLAKARMEEAASHLKKASELDPVSSSIMVDQGLPYYYSRRYIEARTEYETALEFEPLNWYGRMRLGEVCEAGGDLKSARESFETALKLTGGDAAVKCLLARTLALQGQRKAAIRLLSEVEPAVGKTASPYYFALALEGLGDTGSAATYLEHSRTRRDKWYAWYLVDPRMEGIRSSA